MFQQLLTPVGNSLPLSFLVASIPIVVVLVMLVVKPNGLFGGNARKKV